MKATDLMIGDWIKGESNIVARVIEIKEYLIRIDAGIGRVVFEPKELFPIPITPEILEKNGFETEDDVHFSIQGQSDMLELLLVELPFDGYYFDIVRTEKTINKCNQRCYIDRYFASIDYVHQLQHALKLCGIEKEIIISSTKEE
jgi:hypothetical protein